MPKSQNWFTQSNRSCQYCRDVDLQEAFEEAWSDPISKLQRTLRVEKKSKRKPIPDRVLWLGTINHITAEGNCDLCRFVAASFGHVPRGVREGIERASDCRARLRVVQDSEQNWQWSRYLNKNYLALDPAARDTHERLLDIRAQDTISYPSRKSSFSILIEIPVKGSSEIELDTDSDGIAYFSTGRITPVRQKPKYHHSQYPSYWGHVFNPMPSKENTDRYARWLKSCSSSHHMCTIARYPIFELMGIAGFSLIDTHTKKIVPGYDGSQYIALSYVWGKSPRASNTQDRNTGPVREYPRTIEDAIALTRGLNVRYLWVDAFCIASDDPEARADQISKMDIIYQCAVLVIVAASSKSSDMGIHGVSLPRLPKIKSVIGGVEVILSEFSYKDCLAESPWITRGWCFQEGLLAQRCLIMTEKETFFECRQGISRESQADAEIFTQDYLSKDLYFSMIDNYYWGVRNGKLGIYAQIVTSYLQKNLSWESDIVNAFRGISNVMNTCSSKTRVVGEKSCWGLPCNYFGAALTWWPVVDIRFQPNRRILSREAITLPSWSWTAWRMKGIDYTHKMKMQYAPLPSFDWSDSWSKINETGIVEFEAELVSFQDEIEEASTKNDLEYDLSPAWSQEKGSFLSTKDWQGYPIPVQEVPGPLVSMSGEKATHRGDTYGRFALRIRKRGEIVYRVGHEISIPETEWLKAKPKIQHVKLG